MEQIINTHPELFEQQVELSPEPYIDNSTRGCEVLHVTILVYQPFLSPPMVYCKTPNAEMLRVIQDGGMVVATTTGHFLYYYSPLGDYTLTQTIDQNGLIAFEGVCGVDSKAWNNNNFACYARFYQSSEDKWDMEIYPLSETNMETLSYLELVELRGNGKLIPGREYRIEDYDTYVSGVYDLENIGSEGWIYYARSAFSTPFDVIVTADSINKLNENARACRRGGHLYSEKCRPETWEIKYCLDNDTSRFAWASSNGTGVIYYMKDEFGNSAGYDFKNIQFLRYALKSADAGQSLDGQPADDSLAYNASEQPNRYASPLQLLTTLRSYEQTGQYSRPFRDYDFYVGSDILNATQVDPVDFDDDEYCETFNAAWYYTFDYYDGDEHYDLSSEEIDGVDTLCNNNTITPGSDYFLSEQLAPMDMPGLIGTVFEVNDISGADMSCYGNYIGANSSYCTFGADCVNNSVGNGCYNNIFGDICTDNVLRSGCCDNIFGTGCFCNTLDVDSFGNRMGGGCARNTFGRLCTLNVFAPNCSNNSLQGLDNHLVFEEAANFYVESGCSDVIVPLTATLPPYTHELVSYGRQQKHATLIRKTGYNSNVVKSTTDGGRTWVDE